MADVEPETVSWLWPGRVPLGKLTMIEGDPGLGKSTLALEIAASLTRGRALPDAEPVGPANVVILSAEDGLADTIRPRLGAAGADLTRVFAITAVKGDDGTEGTPTLDGNLASIDEAVVRHDAGLVVIDPLMAYLGAGVNSFRDQDVRRVLAPLAALAERCGCAVIIVRHLTKGGGANALYRGGGSIGISGAARSVLLVAKDPEDEARRVIASTKSNLGPPPPSISYCIQPVGDSSRVVFEGVSRFTATDLLVLAAGDAEEDRSALREATDFLEDLMAGGPVPAAEVEKKGRAAGHAMVTLRRAKARLHVVVKKSSMTGPWVWSLPTEGDQTGVGLSTFDDAQSPPKVLTREVRASSDSNDHLRVVVPAGGNPASRSRPLGLPFADAGCNTCGSTDLEPVPMGDPVCRRCHPRPEDV